MEEIKADFVKKVKKRMVSPQKDEDTFSQRQLHAGESV
jgi:hypothetical protein